MVRHFGVLQFKAGVTDAQIKEAFAALNDLVGRIPGLRSLEHGPYQSGEGLNDGFTHGFIMTFDCPAARDDYLPHPLHEAAKEVIVPRLERAVVFDFEV